MYPEASQVLESKTKSRMVTKVTTQIIVAKNKKALIHKSKSALQRVQFMKLLFLKQVVRFV